MNERPQRIIVPDPVIGGKPFLIRERGIYVLEEGPGMLQTCNITHGGSGEIDIIDGIPDQNGLFKGSEPGEDGCCFSSFSPAYMGCWMMNAGFNHGLTVRVSANSGVTPFATLVWTSFKKAQKPSGKFPAVSPAKEPLLKPIKDVKVAPAPGSLMRSVRINSIGLTRIARRAAELYSVMITHNGSFCRLILRTLSGIPYFDQFSTFTGSFVLGACSEDGIIVDVDGMQQPPILQLNWRELDQAVV